MRKKKESLDKPRIKGLRVLYIGVAAIWLVATLGVYKESNREKFDLSVKPGAVNYGTHSAPIIPMVSISSRRTTLPMVSGDEVRSSAFYGHAATPSTTTGSSYRVYTTSSATTHAGGTGSGPVSAGGSFSSTSSSTQRSGGFTVSSMLSMLSSSATANTSISSMTVTPSNLATTSMRMNVGPRRTPSGTGSAGSVVEDEDGIWYWDEEENEWTQTIPIGTVKEEGGFFWEWNGSAWVNKGQVSDLGTPVGDAPWLLILLLVAIYASLRARKKQRLSIR